MTADGTVTVLHAFTGTLLDGASPKAALLRASDGDFYGTASSGGAYGKGTVFRMTAAGTLTVLHSFGSGLADGATPRAPLIQGTDGHFYGTTYSGGSANTGTIFKITAAGSTTILHAFGPTGFPSPPGPSIDGAYPDAALVEASDGNFYGTTSGGGSSRQGAAFRMTPDGTTTLLASFGAISVASTLPSRLTLAADGNLYGTTAFGGGCGHNIGCGAVFRMTPDGSVTVVHHFAGGVDGAHPRSGVIQAKDGNFYGTTHDNDLSYGAGTAFMMTATGVVTRIHAFAGGLTDGASPVGPLLSAAGAFSGPATAGGCSGRGTVFCIPPASSPSNLSPAHDDLDGDGRSDLVVFRPTSGLWYVRSSALGYDTAAASAFQWGLPGDIPVAGDYDGDNRIELTVFRPVTGTWYIRASSLGYSIAGATVLQWGLSNDVPLSGDFDGDRKSDLVVYRPSTGEWYLRYSSQGYAIDRTAVLQWGLPADIPVPGDFDSDGRSDLAVYRPSTGEWHVRYSSIASPAVNTAVFQWGLPGDDVPVRGDFDADGRTDLAIYRPSSGEWHLRYSAFAYNTAAAAVFQWGLPGDVPIGRDFDGDGATDLTVYRPSSGEWYIRQSSQTYNPVPATRFQWGLPGDALVQ